MKTAVSIPDEVFEGAERLARRTKKSRSQLFSDAVKEYVARHAPDNVTDAMDRVCVELGNRRDEFVSSAARRIFERSEWESPKAKFGGPIYPLRQDRVRDLEGRLSSCRGKR